MKLEKLFRKKILILGFGLEGEAAFNFVRYFNSKKEVAIADLADFSNFKKKKRENLTKDKNIKLFFGENYKKAFSRLSKNWLIIKSPGVSLVKEEIKLAKKKGAKITSGTNIFFEVVKDFENLFFTIGVTGTKGKSTTSSLIYEILKEEKWDVRLIGNIGNSALKELFKVMKKPTKKQIVFVMELSSYQLELCKHSPNISVITNMYADHLDYHGTIKKYHQAKENIVKYASPDDFFVFNSVHKNLKALAKKTKAQKVSAIKRLPVSFEKINLVGEHNKENVKLAVTAAKILGAKRKSIEKAFKNFKPLAHRLEKVATKKGITFYDDAISTTPESTIAAINTLPKTETIFLGGTDRGYDFTELAKVINKSKIKNVVLFPDNGRKIKKELKKYVKRDLNILETKKMKEAVNFTFEKTKKGKICLLSTASPSFSLWKNYEEQGREYARLVIKSVRK